MGDPLKGALLLADEFQAERDQAWLKLAEMRLAFERVTRERDAARAEVIRLLTVLSQARETVAEVAEGCNPDTHPWPHEVLRRLDAVLEGDVQ